MSDTVSMPLLYMKGLSTIRIQALKITCCFRKPFKLELLATMWALNGFAMWVWESKATFSRVFVVGFQCVPLFIFIGTSDSIVSGYLQEDKRSAASWRAHRSMLSDRQTFLSGRDDSVSLLHYCESHDKLYPMV